MTRRCDVFFAQFCLFDISKFECFWHNCIFAELLRSYANVFCYIKTIGSIELKEMAGNKPEVPCFEHLIDFVASNMLTSKRKYQIFAF